MIDATYGHLALDAEDHRSLPDAYDAANNGRGHVVGTMSGAGETAEDAAARAIAAAATRALLETGETGLEPATSGVTGRGSVMSPPCKCAGSSWLVPV